MEELKEIRLGAAGLSLVRSQDPEKPSRRIRGTAIVFNAPTTIWDDGDTELRETIQPGAVPESLLRDSDILLTLFHNPERILARSKAGQTQGTLTWDVDEKGVHFEAEMPPTADGDMALALVSGGDIDGCSFWAYLRREDVDTVTSKEGDRVVYTRQVKGFATIRDFTLTPNPAYRQTSVGMARGAHGEKDFRDFKKEREAHAARERSWAAAQAESERTTF